MKMNVIGFICSIVFYCAITSNALEFKYHNNTEIYTILQGFNRTKTSGVRTELYSIGKTKKKNDLWVLMITATRPTEIGIPNVKLIGNMHGNEAAGREILLQFIKFLKDNYKGNKEVGWLLNHTRIHIMPSMNPDGFEEASEDICIGVNGRRNGNGIDLNRDFPDPFHKNLVRNALESKAVRNWMNKVPFILSAALHGGSLVANYPFDSIKDTRSDGVMVESRTPDNDVFKNLATIYSQNHLSMHKANKIHLGTNCNSTFEGGITNGAKWYIFEGSMGDYNYDKHGCMELTLEISCCKYPSSDKLETLWLENKEALLKYCMEANKGITGQIRDSITHQPIRQASLMVVGREKTFYTFKNTGEFWRLLLPGKYQLKVEAKGYHSKTIDFVIKNYTNFMPQLEFKQILLNNATLFTTTPSTTTTTTTFRTTVTMKTKPNTMRTAFEYQDNIKLTPMVQMSTSRSSTSHNFISYYSVFLLHMILMLLPSYL